MEISNPLNTLFLPSASQQSGSSISLSAKRASSYSETRTSPELDGTEKIIDAEVVELGSEHTTLSTSETDRLYNQQNPPLNAVATDTQRPLIIEQRSSSIADQFLQVANPTQDVRLIDLYV